LQGVCPLHAISLEECYETAVGGIGVRPVFVDPLPPDLISPWVGVFSLARGERESERQGARDEISKDSGGRRGWSLPRGMSV
jgi:hypothetical protein